MKHDGNKACALIEAVARDIKPPEFFDARPDATRAMLERLREASGLTKKDMDGACRANAASPLVAAGEDVYFSDLAARCEADGHDCSWRICKPDTDGQDAKAILVEVVEQAIQRPKLFGTREAAKARMLERLKAVKNLSDAELESAEPASDGSGLKSVRWDARFGEDSASCESIGKSYDWRIFSL